MTKLTIHLTDDEAALLREHSDILRNVAGTGMFRKNVMGGSRVVRRANAADYVMGGILNKLADVAENDPTEDYYRNDGAVKA